MTRKLMYVEWVDSWAMHGWQRSDTVERECSENLICTVGFLLADANDHISLVGSLGNWENPDVSVQCHGHICIPKVAIKKMRRLKLSR